MFAAAFGLTVPVVCLWQLRRASWRSTVWAFSSYMAVMLAWGIIDIRFENHQMSGHYYPNGPLIDGHSYYWHTYYTWYFIPYRWVEGAVPTLSDLDRGLERNGDEPLR